MAINLANTLFVKHLQMLQEDTERRRQEQLLAQQQQQQATQQSISNTKDYLNMLQAKDQAEFERAIQIAQLKAKGAAITGSEAPTYNDARINDLIQPTYEIADAEVRKEKAALARQQAEWEANKKLEQDKYNLNRSRAEETARYHKASITQKERELDAKGLMQEDDRNTRLQVARILASSKNAGASDKSMLDAIKVILNTDKQDSSEFNKELTTIQNEINKLEQLKLNAAQSRRTEHLVEDYDLQLNKLKKNKLDLIKTGTTKNKINEINLQKVIELLPDKERNSPKTKLLLDYLSSYSNELENTPQDTNPSDEIDDDITEDSITLTPVKP